MAGGLKVREPAADLAVAAALLSSLTGTVNSPGTAVFGEVALSGAIRPVGQTEARLKEAQKLGLKEAVTAAAAEQQGLKGLKVRPMETIMDLWPGRPRRTAGNGESPSPRKKTFL